MVRRERVLEPVLGRANLRLETDVLVEKVIFEGRRAVGVRFTRAGEVHEAHATAEVILCAGAIGSVEILQRSGVGPEAWLKELGIPILVPHEGVGRNLQDHLQQRAIYKVAGARTLNETYHSLLRRTLMIMQYAIRRTGPLTMAPSQLGIFTRSDPHQLRPNIQFHIQPLSLDQFGEPLHKFPAVTVSACNLRPTSRGTVRLRSADVHSKPLIRPNYLSTDEDRCVAADALRVTRRLMRQPIMRRVLPKEHLPGSLVSDSTEDLAKAAGDIGTTIFHPVGTAKMGAASDPTAVVDERLRVRAVQGLRIVDASVMPSITSGNTNTPTIMIADRGSELILQDARRRT